MRLFFDADVGTGVPKALREVGINCLYMVKRYQKTKRQPGNVAGHTRDELWIPDAGANGWLVISCNKAILETDAQRQLWIDNKVGGVFLTSGQDDAVAVLQLVLRKMAWFGDIDANVARPFAYEMTIGGHARKVL